MGDDGLQPGELQLMERLARRWRDGELVELNQKVVPLAEREALRIGLQCFQILRIEAKITADSELQARAD